MPTTTRTVYLTDENGNALIDAQGNMRTLSFALAQGYSYRLVERASIVSATYSQVVGYSTATGQTIAGVENASEFDVGDFGIVQYAISDRNNTIGYVTCKVTAVGADSLTVNGIGISVSGKDSVVTDVTAGTPSEQDGYTVTPVTFNFEQGNSETVNIQAKHGRDAQQNTVINRTASVDTADENSPDFVENNGSLWVKRITGYEAKVNTLEATLPSARSSTSAATAPNGKIYVFGGEGRNNVFFNDIIEFDPVTQSVTTLEATFPSTRYYTSAATAPNGKIYVFGGQKNNSGSNFTLNDIIEFDPVAQTVTTLEATLPSARYHTSAATAPNGKIYVFGGEGANSDFNDIIEFDPVTQSVTTLEATLPDDERCNTSAATAPSGKIYVFGGYGRNGISLNSIIEFNPVTQTVTTLEATLPSARSSTSAATAPNGKISVFGGSSGIKIDDIVELYIANTQYAYSPAVVLSQEEYTQLKNILNGGSQLPA